MKKRNIVSVRHFKCMECGAEMTATKTCKRSETKHIKTMYCWKCKQERDFQMVDVDVSR